MERLKNRLNDSHRNSMNVCTFVQVQPWYWSYCKYIFSFIVVILVSLFSFSLPFSEAQLASRRRPFSFCFELFLWLTDGSEDTDCLNLAQTYSHKIVFSFAFSRLSSIYEVISWTWHFIPTVDVFSCVFAEISCDEMTVDLYIIYKCKSKKI